METLNRLPFQARKAVFKRLEEIVDIAALTKEEREKYDETIKVYRDNLAVMAFEREAGREEGLREGRQEGERGIARKMKEAGFAVEMIVALTGLPVAEVEAL